MKLRKKSLSIMMSLSLLASALVGCSGNSEEDKTTGESTEKIEITYANWNLGTEEENNLERKMIEEYETLNPNVDIVIAENIDPADWQGSLTTAAAGGELPDVFMLQNIPQGLANEWSMDIKDIAGSDEDWSKMPEVITNETKHNDGIYAIPAGQFFMGYFINKDLFEQENIPSLNFSPTMEEFETAVKNLSQPSKGIIGLGEELQMLEWYPSSVKEGLGWYTWDGEKYNLEDETFVQGINKAKELFKNGYVFDSLTQEQKANFNGEWFGDAWNQGQIGVRWEGTWATNDWSQVPFEYEFVGVPGMGPIITNDYLTISKSAENPQEVYNFAKWMTFSKEGTLKRIEIAEANDLVYASLPLMNDEELLTKYFEYNPVIGLEDAYENIEDGVVETVKTVPGYVASRWEALTGIKVGDIENAKLGDLLFHAMRGDVKIEDYIKQANELANKNYQDASSAIK